MSSDDLSDLSDISEHIPEIELEFIARCLLPKIQAYFDSLEGKTAFEKWKKEKDEIT